MKSFANTLAHLALIIFVASIAPANCQDAPPPCPCPFIYWPVCGADGQTYPNKCAAACAGVEVQVQGTCTCACTREYKPLCGTDGLTYGNQCLLDCASVQVAYEGPCMGIEYLGWLDEVEK